MSWYVSIPDTKVADAESVVDALALEASQESPESLEQLAAGKVAVMTLVESGAFGDQSFQGYISGHANANHQPRAGWSNDCITLSVTMLPTPEDAPAAAPQPVAEEPVPPVEEPAPAEPEPVATAPEPPADGDTEPGESDPSTEPEPATSGDSEPGEDEPTTDPAASGPVVAGGLSQ